MSTAVLVPYIWFSSYSRHARDQMLTLARGGWREDDGLDDSVQKLIWLGAAVAVGVAAVAFAITIFNAAKTNVPTPTPAAP
jgi:hypothetical protein